MAAVDAGLQALMREVGAQTAAARGKMRILDRIVQHPFAVPGKRIRPALVLLTAHAVSSGGQAPHRESLIALAGAVEILHAASLVHDDIIDNADSRRHQVSLNKRFGNRVAVLAGDILYTHFFSVITGLTQLGQAKRFSILDIFLDTTKAMCMGEIIAQEVAASGHPLAQEEYVEIATDKTAVLFAACCRTAALLCDAPESAAALPRRRRPPLRARLPDGRRPGGQGSRAERRAWTSKRSPSPTPRRRGTASHNCPRAPTVIPSAISWIT